MEAETRARPLDPSAIKFDEAAVKPAGSEPTEMLAAVEEAAGLADDELAEGCVPAIRVRSEL